MGDQPMDDEAAGRLGRWIREARQRRGWTQEAFAAQVPITKGQLSKIETGQQGPRGPNARTLNGIEEALSVPAGTLRAVVEDKNPSPDPDVLSATDGDEQIVRLIEAVQSEQSRTAGQVADLADQLVSLVDRLDDLERRLGLNSD